MSAAIRVLIVDDAAFMRRSLNRLLKDAEGIEVVGEAVNGREGIERFRSLRPDVVCLDIDMPEMNGITALKHIMSIRPTPVIIVSSLTDRDNIPFEAVRLGAIDFFPKPSSLSGNLQKQTQHLLYLLRSARRVRSERLRRIPLTPRATDQECDLPCRHLVVVAGTLGSTSNLIRLLSLLPTGDEEVAILCKVPIHAAVRASFAESIHSLLGWAVSDSDSDSDSDSQGHEPLRAGVVYFVPLDRAVRFEKDLLRYEPASEPCLDATFRAVGERFGHDATAILLAGDQSAGMSGLAAAAERGAECFVQDERSALFSNWEPRTTGTVVLRDLDAIVDTVAAKLGRTHRTAVGL